VKDSIAKVLAGSRCQRPVAQRLEPNVGGPQSSGYWRERAEEVEVIAAWSVDRLDRSLQDFVGFLGEAHGAGMNRIYISRRWTLLLLQGGRSSRC
jgi:hypothetical protein